MSPTKHILFLVPGFPADENDFNCIPPLQDYLIKFKSEHPAVKISVITFQYPYRNQKYLWNGIEIYPLNGKNSVLRKSFVWLKAMINAGNINKFHSVSTIHSLWLGECAFIGNRLADKFRCQHICTLMGQDVKSSNRYLRLSKNEKIKIVALLQNQSNQFFHLTNRKPDEIVHWGIEDQNFKIVDRDIDLLAVGSLIPLKNYSLFIRLSAELKKTYPGLKCKLAGTGPDLYSLQTLAKEEGVSENIEFTGLLNRQEIFKLMQRSKILVHPSTFEGFGYVFAEALVNGMNIVSFDVGAAHRHPKWFVAKSEEDFMNIVKNLLTDSLDYNSVNLFPLKETVERYASIYGLK